MPISQSPRCKAFSAAMTTGFLILGAPAFAMEATHLAPVKITSCVVARDEASGIATGRSPNSAGVTIVVVNESTATIKDMQLSGVYNGLTLTDTFSGPFTAGETYTLHKQHTPLAYEGPDAACVLNHVTFADGTDWTMAAPPVSQR
jgi:hypothetical protein